ncbi:hypothetical protein GIB67_014507, partial [Kingdonia uniflora]
KNRKEAKHMDITDSIRAAKDNIEELKRIAQDQKVMKYQYATIIYQQLKALTTLEMDTNQGIRHKEHIQDAISWYNKFLGFRVEGGHVLDCDPYLGDMKDFIQDLNQTNGLFKFVRIMREKFQATTLKGAISENISMFPDTSTVSTPTPAAYILCDGSDSLEMEKEVQVQLGELQKSPRKVNHGRMELINYIIVFLKSGIFPCGNFWGNERSIPSFGFGNGFLPVKLEAQRASGRSNRKRLFSSSIQSGSGLAPVTEDIPWDLPERSFKLRRWFESNPTHDPGTFGVTAMKNLYF